MKLSFGKHSLSVGARARVGVLRRLYLRHTFFNTKQRIAFYRMLHNLTANGVSLQSALTLIKSKFEQMKQRNTELNQIISDVLYSMRIGMPFHKAFARWIPNQEYLLIESSHQDIPRALSIVIQHAEHLQKIQNALAASLTYPAVMLLLLILTLVGLAFYIMPNMAKLISPDRWPPISHNLYVLANFIAHYYQVLAVLLITVVSFVAWSMANLTNPLVRRLLDRLPPWNIYKGYTATSFLLALSSSIKLGASFNSSILKIHGISSPYLKRFLIKIKARLMSGSNFGDAIDIGIFDSITLVSLSVFSTTNRLEQGIQYLADHNLEEQKELIVKRGKLLGYITMGFVASMIGWIVLAMYGMQSAVSS